MIRDCFYFNPVDTSANLAGIELQRLFDDRRKNLPRPKPQPAYDDDMDVGDDNQHRTLFYFILFSVPLSPSRAYRDVL